MCNSKRLLFLIHKFEVTTLTFSLLISLFVDFNKLPFINYHVFHHLLVISFVSNTRCFVFQFAIFDESKDQEITTTAVTHARIRDKSRVRDIGRIRI